MAPCVRLSRISATRSRNADGRRSSIRSQSTSAFGYSGENRAQSFMDWLNYHHLLYFWTVAKAGTIARASEQLQIAAPTISGQIPAPEQSLCSKLFARSGRNQVLTGSRVRRVRLCRKHLL